MFNKPEQYSPILNMKRHPSPRVTKSISLRKDLAIAATGKASRSNRSLSNYIETLILKDQSKAKQEAESSIDK